MFTLGFTREDWIRWSACLDIRIWRRNDERSQHYSGSEIEDQVTNSGDEEGNWKTLWSKCCVQTQACPNQILWQWNPYLFSNRLYFPSSHPSSRFLVQANANPILLSRYKRAIDKLEAEKKRKLANLRKDYQELDRQIDILKDKGDKIGAVEGDPAAVRAKETLIEVRPISWIVESKAVL